MIDLDVRVPKWEHDVVIYTIKNIGVKAICGDIFICSKLFGMITVKNDFLNFGSEIEHRHYFSEVIGFRESARVFARVYEGIYIHSDKFKRALPLGIAPASVNTTSYEDVDLRRYATTLTNRIDASVTMRGASVKIKFFGLFNLANMSSPGDAEILEDGLLYRIPDLLPGQSWTFGPIMRLGDANVNTGEPVIVVYEYQFNEYQIETWNLQTIHTRFLTAL